jgi:hypothetical protein
VLPADPKNLHPDDTIGLKKINSHAFRRNRIFTFLYCGVSSAVFRENIPTK